MDHKSVRAFSLIEILVATAITAVLVVLLAQVVSSVTFVWKTGNSNAERRQSGRALMDYIAQELRAATLPLDPVAGAAPPNLQFVLNPPSVSPEFRNPSALFWQAATAKNSAAGDLGEFGYFVRWIDGKPPRAVLCRLFVDSNDSENYLVYSNSTWVDDALLNKVAPADRSSGYLGFFTQNIVGFWARCLDAGGSEYKDAGGDPVTAADSYDSRTTKALPRSVEISIVLIDSRAADIMTAGMQSQLSALVNASVNADACVTQIQTASGLQAIAKGAHAYTTRVLLENAR